MYEDYNFKEANTFIKYFIATIVIVILGVSIYIYNTVGMVF